MADIRDGLELSKVIGDLRVELENAQKAGEGKDLRFGVEGIEIELDLSVMKMVEGDAAATLGMEADDMSLLKYVVGKVSGEISISGKGKYEKVANQKVKLMLNVKDKGGETLLSDDEPS